MCPMLCVYFVDLTVSVLYASVSRQFASTLQILLHIALLRLCTCPMVMAGALQSLTVAMLQAGNDHQFRTHQLQPDAGQTDEPWRRLHLADSR